MGDEQYVIELEDADTEGQALRWKFAPEDDDAWLQQALRREPGSARIRIRAIEDEDDTEGHRARLGPYVRVLAESDDDTAGHAISIHFPSLEEADAFRRRLLATGLIVGSVALGATVGGALAGQASTGPAEAGAATTSVSGEYAADRGIGVAPAAAAGATSVGGEYASDRGVGVAPAAAAGATSVSGEYASDRGVGIAPDAAAAGASSVSGEYASDRGVGVAPDAAAPDDGDASAPQHESNLGPAPR